MVHFRPWICIWLNHHKSFHKNRSHTAGQQGHKQHHPTYMVPQHVGICWRRKTTKEDEAEKNCSQGSKKRPWKRKLLSSVWQSGRHPLQTRGDKWEKDLAEVCFVGVHKQDNGSSPHCSINISRVKWNPRSSVWECCYTEMHRKFSAVLLECQSALTTDAGYAKTTAERQHRAITALIPPIHPSGCGV